MRWSWESQQAKQLRGKVVGVVQITHSMKSEMCTTSPWAQGPICNVIARTAWLPVFVDSVGGQGVHPIKGEQGVVEKVRMQAKAALISETQGSQLHPETGEAENRKRRKRSDAGVYQQLRVTELSRVRGVECNGQQTGGTRDGELSVPAAQELEKQADERKKKKRGEKASEMSNSSERGTKRMRATDEEHVRNVRNQREQAAEHGGRSSDTGSV